MSELSRRSGVRMTVLSFAETGRYLPTGEEFSRVIAALETGDVSDVGIPVSTPEP